MSSTIEELFEFELGTLEYAIEYERGKRARAWYVVNKVKNKKK